MGAFFTTILVVYTTLLGWAVATLFFQLAEGHSLLFTGISLAVLTGIYSGLFLLSRMKLYKPF
jgi:ferrous iron transport protein B